MVPNWSRKGSPCAMKTKELANCATKGDETLDYTKPYFGPGLTKPSAENPGPALAAGPKYQAQAL